MEEYVEKSKLSKVQVKHLRAIAGMTYPAMARLARVSVETWKAYEEGEEKLPAASLSFILSALDNAYFMPGTDGKPHTLYSSATCHKLVRENDGTLKVTSKFPIGDFTVFPNGKMASEQWKSVTTRIPNVSRTVGIRTLVTTWCYHGGG